MKNLAIYKAKKDVTLDLSLINKNLWSELTEQQQEKVGFIGVVDNELIINEITNYQVLKLRHSKRKPINKGTLEREFNKRLSKLEKQDISVDIEELLLEVENELIALSDINTKDTLVVYDIVNNIFMFDANRNTVDNLLTTLHEIFLEPVSLEIVSTQPFIYQEKLTNYLIATPLDPFILGENVKLGKKAIAGSNPSPANILIKKEDLQSDEVTNHIESGKVVHTLELDFDGCVFFNIDHTFHISGIKYDGNLKYKESSELSEYDNFISEYVHILPELSRMSLLLLKDSDQVEV